MSLQVVIFLSVAALAVGNPVAVQENRTEHDSQHVLNPCHEYNKLRDDIKQIKAKAYDSWRIIHQELKHSNLSSADIESWKHHVENNHAHHEVMSEKNKQLDDVAQKKPQRCKMALTAVQTPGLEGPFADMEKAWKNNTNLLKEILAILNGKGEEESIDEAIKSFKSKSEEEHRKFEKATQELKKMMMEARAKAPRV
ncbi:hypothetical protein QAD02_019161 [Eretmocerus hayati]|uniref:Uncharacterized protein n=1 Tax=Eretmocerus hayati TaxID=131215 RepID=A0ACC2PJ90_9HYME|nr:hypothetical protein QAD02_019161 [Eretmocerus hayati]